MIKSDLPCTIDEDAAAVMVQDCGEVLCDSSYEPSAVDVDVLIDLVRSFLGVEEGDGKESSSWTPVVDSGSSVLEEGSTVGEVEGEFSGPREG